MSDNEQVKVKDGFRKRKKRPDGWLAKAIKDGSVRDPNISDPDAGKDYSTATVVNPPVATLDGKGT